MAIPKPTRRPPPAATGEVATETKASPKKDKPVKVKPPVEDEAESDDLAQAAQELHDHSRVPDADESDVELDEQEEQDEQEERDAAPEKTPGKDVVATRSTRQAMTAEDAADAQQFGDLDEEVGFGSFPMVKLKDAAYQITDMDHLLTGFDGVILGSRKKFLIKATGEEDEERIVYGYGQTDAQGEELTANGRRVSDVLAEWAEDGDKITPVRSRYYEAMCHVLRVFHDNAAKEEAANEELAGTIVMLSIAPSSVNRLAGHKRSLSLKKNPKTGQKLRMNEAVTRFEIGSKITPGGSSKKAFNPWKFKLNGLAPEGLDTEVLAEYGSDTVEE